MSFFEKMKYRFLIIFLAYYTWENVNGETMGVCTVCRCVDHKTVDCNRLELPSSFQSSAWNDIINTQYTEIDLSNNHIGYVTAFPTLNITKLNLRNNRIIKIDRRAFRNLTGLIELDLGENELTTKNLDPNIFQGFFSSEYFEPLSIRNLDLSGNELHSLNYLTFEHLPHIARLSLNKNPFKILDKTTVIAISNLQELECLDLSDTQLRELPVGFLHSLKSLRELILKNNLLKEVPSDILYEGHNLAALNLDGNPIKIISTERPFPEMPTLKFLHLSHLPELTRIENYSMHGLQGLEYLHCSNNPKLEYVSPVTFALNLTDNNSSRPNISNLDLSNNALRYLDKNFLRIDKMKYVNLLGNNWSCDCENQWMVSELVPILLKINSPVSGLICSEPTAMKGQHLLALHNKSYEMRCLDYYGNDPENDSAILITVFSIIIAVMVVGLIITWKMKIRSCRRGDRSDYSRAFYRPAQTEEKY